MKTLRKIGLALIFVLFGAAAPAAVFAYPLLQLDIGGGTYDSVGDNIVIENGTFTLYAILTPQENATAEEIADLLSETYYISVAIVPSVEESFDAAVSFDFDGTTYDVTEDMVFGTPPVEATQAFDSGDLSKHGVFPTYFIEVDFQFDSGDTTTPYNTQDDPGGSDTSGSGAYYVAFSVDSVQLSTDFFLHFDLYSLEVVDGDTDVADSAPFSHDAETVPEPHSLLLLGAGLISAALLRRRKG